MSDPTLDKINSARTAGYNDDDIVSYLAKDPDFANKATAAKSAGYSSADILSHLQNTHATQKKTSYLEDVVNNAKIGYGQLKDVLSTDLSTPEGRAKTLELGKGLVKGTGQAIMGGLQKLASGNPDPQTEAIIANLPADEQAKIAQTSKENEAAFGSAVRPFTNPISSFRENPLTTTATLAPFVLKGAGAALSKISKLAPEAELTTAGGEISPFIKGENGLPLTPKYPVNSAGLPIETADLSSMPALAKEAAESIRNIVPAAKDIFGEFQKQHWSRLNDFPYERKLVTADAPPNTVVDLSTLKQRLADEISNQKYSTGGNYSPLEEAINKNKALQGFLNGNSDNLTLEQADNLSNEISSQLSKSIKSAPKGKAITPGLADQQRLSIIGEIERSIGENFPGMDKVNADYGSKMDLYNTLKSYFKDPKAVEATLRSSDLPQTVQQSISDYFVNNPDVVNRIRAISQAQKASGKSLKSLTAATPADILKENLLKGNPNAVSQDKILDFLKSSKVAVDRDAMLDALKKINEGGASSRPEIPKPSTYSHRPAGQHYGASLDDLTKIYPEDIYLPSAKRLYGSGHIADKIAIDIIKSVRGNPNADIKIYRAVKFGDPGIIKNGDWVTITRDYAKTHGESILKGKYKIIEKTVKAKDIYNDANSIQEYGYNPSGAD